MIITSNVAGLPAKSLAIIGILLSTSLIAQGQWLPGQPTVIAVNTGRPLAAALEQVETLYLAPIFYEEAPFENTKDLITTSGIQRGVPRVLVSTPITHFAVNLGTADLTAFDAVQTVLKSYYAAGLPGIYKATHGDGWISVAPDQILGSDGVVRAVRPLMSLPVSFPLAVRTISDTLQQVADEIAQPSGRKVRVLNLPFSPSATVELFAAGENARQVVVELGEKLNLSLSLQCLYDPSDKSYYINTTVVSPASPPGSETRPPNPTHTNPHPGHS